MVRAGLTSTFVLVVILSTAAAGDAALVSVNDGAFGANSFTRDTATGLAWLDISHSDGLTFQYVASQLGPSGAFAGLRHATAAELNQLILHAGVNPALPGLLNLTAVQNFETLVGGPTGTQSLGGGGISLGSRTVTFGMTSDAAGPSAVNYGGVAHTNSTLLGGPGGFSVPNAGSQHIATADPLVGHWLVRPVPEPATGVLLAAGALLAVVGHIRGRPPILRTGATGNWRRRCPRIAAHVRGTCRTANYTGRPLVGSRPA